MKITNRQALILLELEGSEFDIGVWRPDIAKELGTASTTIYDNLIKLRKKKLIERYETTDGKKGRNRIYWYATDLGNKAIRVIKNGLNITNSII